MRTTLLVALLLAAPGWGWLGRVRTRNAAVAAAQAAHRAGQAQTEAAAWARAVAAEAGRPAPALLLNLGHAQFRAGETGAARATYGRLLGPAVPPATGSAARQQLAVLALADGQAVAALGLLREAVRLAPRNAVARYNYERLRAYLARPNEAPQNQPPGSGPGPPTPPPPAPAKGGPTPAQQPKPRPGTDRPQAMPSATPGGNGEAMPRPDPNGHPGLPQPTVAAGRGAQGRRQPGAGSPRPVPVGERPGARQGLNNRAETGADAPAGRSLRPGTEAASAADQQLQTQRARLQALNLTPAQARQVLEALRAQEAQYLQQVTRPAAAQEADGPTW